MNYVYQKYEQKLEINCNNSVCIKADNFPKSANFLASWEFALLKSLK